MTPEEILTKLHEKGMICPNAAEAVFDEGKRLPSEQQIKNIQLNAAIAMGKLCEVIVERTIVSEIRPHETLEGYLLRVKHTIESEIRSLVAELEGGNK